MKWVSGRAGWLAGAVALGACGGDGGVRESDGCPATLSYELTARPFVDKYCLPCHASGARDRRGAPPSVNFDALSGLEAHGSMVHRYVQEGVMPPPAPSEVAQPSAQERDTFVSWTECAGIADAHEH